MRILIAEDDRISRRLLERKLTSWGYEVVSCNNGAEAWQALHREDAPNLAILNWMMPGMNGVEVCREIRKQKQRGYIYIILLTGRDRKRDIVEGMSSGPTTMSPSHSILTSSRSGYVPAGVSSRCSPSSCTGRSCGAFSRWPGPHATSLISRCR